MKRLLLLAALLAAAVSTKAQVQPPVQASNGFSGATQKLTAALTKPTASTGTWIIVGVESTCTAAPKVTDSVGRVYVLDLNKAGTEGGASLWHAVNTSAGTTTVNVAFANCSYAAIQVIEAAVGGVEGTPIGGTTFGLVGTTFTIGSLTTTANDFIVAAAHDNYGVGGLTAGSGFTLVPATQSPAAAEYQAVTPGTYAVAFGGKAGYRYTGVAVAYTPSGVTPPPPPPPPPNTCSGTGTLSVNGSGTPLTMASTFTMPAGTVGVAYSGSIATAASVTGGTPPYTYAITSGALPAGLKMSTAGAVTGTPTAAGTASFVVTVTDSLGTAMAIPMTMEAGQ
jgi:hypothetical protein